MKTFNATQAAIAAGYSERSAHTTGWRHLQDVAIKAEIDRRFDRADTQTAMLPPQRVKRNSTTLYLIRDVHFGRTKIGIASDLEHRFSSLQTGSPIELYVYAYFEIPKAKTHENHLHQRYSHKHLHGEWFNLSEQDLQTICDYLGGYVVVEEGIKELKQAKLL
jgi:hypothetical protein